MAGLLYKDFIGIKGKRVLWILFGLTAAFTILRFLLPGDIDMPMAWGQMENADGELKELTVGAFYDSILIMLPLFFIMVGIALPSTWTELICRHDEKNKTRRFTGTLPLEKNTYIASKYIFIGISLYVLFSLELMWIIIYGSRAGNSTGGELMTMVSQSLVSVCGISLFIASIELPLFITLGVKKGILIKAGVIEGLVFLIVLYIFFGNLEKFKNFNIFVFMDWCREHVVLVSAVSTISPVLEIFIFWLSYKITCKIATDSVVD